MLTRSLFWVALLIGVAPALSAKAQTPCDPSANRLIIYHAGSLTATFAAVERLFTQQTGVCVTDVSAGSVDAARRITAGNEPCDIFASADYEIIDRFLKPAGYADFDLLFGEGSMVLAYTTASKSAGTITKPGDFSPPDSVPDVADDWYKQLQQSGLWVGGSHPFLDPSGYHADQIFQLAELSYRVPNLYDTLLQHYSVVKSTDVLGQTYDYSFSYEHTALAAYKANPSAYRYARLPIFVNLSEPKLNPYYAKSSITMPGLRTPGAAPLVKVTGSRVVWGLTVLKNAPDPDNAIAFLQLLFGEQGVAVQTENGPTPISPPVVSPEGAENLPQALQSLVSVSK